MSEERYNERYQRGLTLLMTMTEEERAQLRAVLSSPATSESRSLPEGVVEERRAVVAYLRRYAIGSGWVHGKTPGAAWENGLVEAADAIDRGDHVAALTPSSRGEGE